MKKDIEDKININTALLGYNKKQTDFEFDKLKTRIKILEADVLHLKNVNKKLEQKKSTK